MLLKSLFKKKKRNLFIHIPKTGGSTFVGLLKESVKITSAQKQQQTHKMESVGNVDIKHVDFNRIERPFKAPEIFESRNHKSVSEAYNVFMIVRHPVERLVSEFNFQYHILNGKDGNTNAAIITRLRNKPNTVKDYTINPETQNYQCKFLLGRKIADPEPVTDAEFKTLIDTIDNLPIHCGVTDAYDTFLNTFETISGITLKRDIVVRKKTPQHLKAKINKSVADAILKLNDYDYKLYLHVKNKVKTNQALQESPFLFNDKDDYII